MKKIIALVLTLALAINVGVNVFAQESPANKLIPVDNISVILKGDTLDLSGKPVIIYNGNSMLPLTTLFSKLDDGTGSVAFEASTKMVTVKTAGKTFKFYLGQTVLDVDGVVKVVPGAFPVSYLGATYLPTSYVNDIFALDVTWFGSSRTIALQDPAAFAEIKEFIEAANAKYSDSKKMSMDIDMSYNMKATGAIELDMTATALSSMQIDVENMFIHTSMTMDAADEVQAIDMYYTEDAAYMSMDGGETWLTSEIPTEQIKELVEKAAQDSSYLGKFDEMTYSGYKKTTNANGDTVIEGTLPVGDMLDALNLGELTGGALADMTIGNFHMTMIFDKDTNELTAIDMAFTMSMSVTEDEVNTVIVIDCVANVKNISYAPDFESIVPADVIFAATGVLAPVETVPEATEDAEIEEDAETEEAEDAETEEAEESDEDAETEEAADAEETAAE